MTKKDLVQVFELGLVELAPMHVIAVKMRYGLAPYEKHSTLDDLARMWNVTVERILEILFLALAIIHDTLSLRLDPAAR